MNSRKYSLILLCALGLLSFSFLNACGRQEEQSKGLSFVGGAWGHLSRVEDVLPTPMYLIHLEKGAQYNVCLDQNLENDYPGIASEVEAAIKIWGYYIGRDIKVSFHRRALPLPTRRESSDDYTKRVWELCQSDRHIVVSSIPLSGNNVGQTTNNYSYRPGTGGKHQIVSYTRGLFLHKNADWSSNKVNWRTLSNVKNKEISSDDILKSLKERTERIFLTGEDELLTLKTLVHEFGHVWGMCDQYALAGNQTNCDPDYATLNDQGHIVLEPNATMSSSSWIASVYLHKDDIEGIQKFLDRPEFVSSGYPNRQELELAEIPVVNLSDLEFFSLNKAQALKDKGQIEANFSLVVNKPFKYRVGAHNKERNSWSMVGWRQSSSSASWKNMNFNLAIQDVEDFDQFKVEVQVDGGEIAEKILSIE